MPTIDSDLQRKALTRELAKSRKVGDFLTCDGGAVLAGRPARSGDFARHQLPQQNLPSAAELEAERKRKDHELWLRSLGPW